MQILKPNEAKVIGGGINLINTLGYLQYAGSAMQFFLYQIDNDPIRVLQQARVKKAVLSHMPAILSAGLLQLTQKTLDENSA